MSDETRVAIALLVVLTVIAVAMIILLIVILSAGDVSSTVTVRT